MPKYQLSSCWLLWKMFPYKNHLRDNSQRVIFLQKKLNLSFFGNYLENLDNDYLIFLCAVKVVHKDGGCRMWDSPIG